MSDIRVSLSACEHNDRKNKQQKINRQDDSDKGKSENTYLASSGRVCTIDRISRNADIMIILLRSRRVTWRQGRQLLVMLAILGCRRQKVTIV